MLRCLQLTAQREMLLARAAVKQHKMWVEPLGMSAGLFWVIIIIMGAKNAVRRHPLSTNACRRMFRHSENPLWLSVKKKKNWLPIDGRRIDASVII